MGGKGKGKTIEEIYQKKTQLEHILLRPDTYIGSTEKQQQQMWVMDGDKMTQRTISYVPGLYKIFDEILVNAADNKARDPSMDLVKVDINPVCVLCGMMCGDGQCQGEWSGLHIVMCGIVCAADMCIPHFRV